MKSPDLAAIETPQSTRLALAAIVRERAQRRTLKTLDTLAGIAIAAAVVGAIAIIAIFL